MNVSYIVRNEMNCLNCKIYYIVLYYCIEFRKCYTKFMVSMFLFSYLAVKPVADLKEVQLVRLKCARLEIAVVRASSDALCCDLVLRTFILCLVMV